MLKKKLFSKITVVYSISQEDILQRPNVILKDGVQANELESGVDFEVKGRYKDYGKLD